MLNNIKHDDIYVVDTFEEASQFKHLSNDQPVEVGTAVGYDSENRCSTTNNLLSVDLKCFDGVYFDPDDVL